VPGQSVATDPVTTKRTADSDKPAMDVYHIEGSVAVPSMSLEVQAIATSEVELPETEMDVAAIQVENNHLPSVVVDIVYLEQV
jgi:hypothetical protein